VGLPVDSSEKLARMGAHPERLVPENPASGWACATSPLRSKMPHRNDIAIYDFKQDVALITVPLMGKPLWVFSKTINGNANWEKQNADRA